MRHVGVPEVRRGRFVVHWGRVIFAVGDIHGCAEELRLLLNKLDLTPETTVVFVGDYVDRGPNSRAVIDTILELRESCNVITLMGNHEAMFIDFLENPHSARAGAFIYNGGSATLASYADEHGQVEIPSAHVQFLYDLRIYWESEHAFFVHAGLPDVPLRDLDPVRDRPAMLWIRRKFLASDYAWEKVVVHGHTPVQKVTIKDNRINVDTGCVFKRRLSAISMPGERIYSVARQKKPSQVLLRDVASRRAAVRFTGVIPVRILRRGVAYDFETIDYSEIGMYMRDLRLRDAPVLADGERIEGLIGPDQESLIEFRGQIVRRRRDDRGDHYGVRILSSGPPQL